MSVKKYSAAFEEKWEKLRWSVLRIPKATAWEVWQTRGKSERLRCIKKIEDSCVDINASDATQLLEAVNIIKSMVDPELIMIN